MHSTPHVLSLFPPLLSPSHHCCWSLVPLSSAAHDNRQHWFSEQEACFILQSVPTVLHKIVVYLYFIKSVGIILNFILICIQLKFTLVCNQLSSYLFVFN